MENPCFLVNRFSPGNPKPIFFAGRRLELNEYFVLLQDFLRDFKTGYSKHIYIVKAKYGIGKTTFLLRWKKQIQDEVAEFIPIYLAANDFQGNLAAFYRLFFHELELMFHNSPTHREKLLAFLSKKNWQHIALKISPSLVPAAYKLITVDGKLQSSRTFFEVFRDLYKGPEALKEMFVFWNWLLQEAGLFLVLIVDHLETLKVHPEFLELLLSNFQELEKYRRRFLIFLSIESAELDMIASGFSLYSGPQLPYIFQRISSISIRDEKRVPYLMESIFHRLVFYDKLMILHLANEFAGTQVLQQFSKPCPECNFTCQVLTVPDGGIVACIQQWSNELIKQLGQSKGITEHTSEVNYKACQQVSHEILQAKEAPEAIRMFRQLLINIDSFLQQTNQMTWILVLQNLERVIAAPLGFSTDKSKTGESMLSKTSTLTPSPPFLLFYQHLEQLSQHLQKICWILLLKLSDQEWIMDSSSKAALTLNSMQKELKPLAQSDAFQLLQEIAGRSGVLISNEVLEDIYQRLGGHPFDLHCVGSHVIATIPQNISAADLALIQDALLQKFDPQKQLTSNRLHRGIDGRTRILLSPELYQNIAIHSPEELYEKMLLRVRNKLAQNILEILCDQLGSITVKEILELLQKKDSAITADRLLSELQQLHLGQWINLVEENVEILHPYLRKFLLRMFKKNDETSQMKSMKTAARGGFQRNLPLVPSTRRVMATSPTSSAPEENVSIVERELAILKENKFPSSKTLESLSKYFGLKENAAAFKTTTEYLYTIAAYLKHHLKLNLDIPQLFSILKNYLTASGENKPFPNLKIAVQQTLTDAEGISSHQHDSATLARVYWMQYYLTRDSKDWDAALEHCYECFAHLPLPPELPNFLVFMEELLSSIGTTEQKENVQNWQEILQWTHKLMMIPIELPEIPREFLPVQMPKYFYPYLLKYFGKLVQNPILFNNLFCWIQCYCPWIPENGLLENLIQQWSLDSRLALQKLGLRLLLLAVPYINETMQSQTLQDIEEAIGQHTDLTIRRSLLNQLADCHILYAADDLVSFFYGLLKNDDEPTIQQELCRLLVKLYKFCSPEFQPEIISVLEEYFDAHLANDSGISQNHWCEYVVSLMVLTEKNNELIEKWTNRLLQFMQEEHQQGIPSAEILARMHYNLSPAQQNTYMTMIAAWFKKNQTSYKQFVLRYLYFLYPNGMDEQSLDTIHPNIFVDSSVVARAWFLRLDLRIREQVWDNWCSLLEFGWFPRQSSAYQAQLFSGLMNLVHAVPPDHYERLTKCILYILQNQDPSWCTACSDLAFILPYLNEKDRTMIQHHAWDWLLHNPNLTVLPLLMQVCMGYVSHDSSALSCWELIRNAMNIHPDLLLSQALLYFASIHTNLPEVLLKELQKDAVHYLQFPAYAEPAAAFLLRVWKEIPGCDQLAYRYQFYGHSSSLSFALYELFPTLLVKTPSIAVNYQKICKRNPLNIAFQIAKFHYHAGNFERGQELLDWVIQNGTRTMQFQALEQEYRWQVIHQRTSEANATLEKIQKMFFAEKTAFLL